MPRLMRSNGASHWHSPSLARLFIGAAIKSGRAGYGLYGSLYMKKTIVTAIAAVGIFAGAAAASAQSTTTTTTTTWSPDEGQQLQQSWTESHYSAVTDPAMQPAVGMVLPPSVTYYPLPAAMNVPDRDNYSYVVINNRPVVVERTTRRVVHVWP